MGAKSLAYKIYSAVAIVVFGSGYVLANYFPETAEKIGLGWLNSHKSVQAEGAVWSCGLNWDWGAGTAVSASHVDYELSCTAKVDLSLEDFYVYISENTRYTNSSGPGGQYSTQAGSEHLSAQGAVVLKAGQNYEHRGTLVIPRSLTRQKNSDTRRKLIASARLSYSGAPPTSPKEGQDPHQLFIYTGVY